MWSPYTQANINKVEKVQRRAARWVSNDYSSYSSVTQMLNTLGWRSLEQRRADVRLILFYKIVYGLIEITIPAYIRHPVKMTRTMHSMHYIQIPTTASYYKYSFFPLVIVQWKKTPCPCCHVPGPEFFQVHCMQPSSLHAIDHETLFLSAFNLFSN